MSPLARSLRGFVRLYQLTLSPIIGPVCRYEPSCSHYAVTALETHGGFRGSWLALRRLARCHPWGGRGYDPVPPPKHNHETRSDHLRPTLEN